MLNCLFTDENNKREDEVRQQTRARPLSSPMCLLELHKHVSSPHDSLSHAFLSLCTCAASACVDELGKRTECSVCHLCTLDAVLDAPLLHVSHRLSSLKPLAKTPWSQNPKPRVSLTRQNPKPTTRFRHLRYFGVDRVDFHACFTRGLQPDFVPPKGFVPVVATSATLESRTSTQTNFRISWKERGCSKSEKCIVLSVRDSAGAHLAESPKWLEKVLVSAQLVVHGRACG